MPTRTQLGRWDIGALDRWAATLTKSSNDCVQYLGKVRAHFTDVRDDWSGAAYDAAYDRVLEDHDQGRKLTVEVEDLAVELSRAAETVASYRSVLLGRVADAEDAALAVAEDWQVSGAPEESVIAHQELINSAYYDLNNAVQDIARRVTTQADIVRSAGDLLGSGLDVTAAEDETSRLGQQDGRVLAELADEDPSRRDPAAFDRIASQLPPHPLTDAELNALAAGGEVDSLPAEVQDYYREFYNAAGKDGILALSEHLKAQEEAGNTVAAAQRDSLANGLAIISNEDIGSGRNADGELIDAGSYQAVPEDIRELIESRLPNLPGHGTQYSPDLAAQLHMEGVSQLSDLLNEANPGYAPGTELGTQLYLKTADMVEHPYGGFAVQDLYRSELDSAAAGFAEFAGRNNDAAHQIWTGEGMPEGYDPEETVRTLTGYDWSESDNGRGAATLIDRITEESQLPPEDPRGMRGREALAGLGQMLAPRDDDEVWQQQQDSFARNPELATSVSRGIAANLDAVSVPGTQDGFTNSAVWSDGRVALEAEESNRLLQLGGYSEEGRVNLTAAVEQRRIEELAHVMRTNPDDMSVPLARSDAGTLSGRIDNAIWDAMIHQDQVKGDEALNPTDALYRAKMLGASIASALTDEAIGRIPGGDIGAGITGFDGDAVENQLQEWLGKPEYEFLERPSDASLRAEASLHAKQAILNAAYMSGFLPAELHISDGPIEASTMEGDASAQEAFNDFLDSHRLSQYLDNYRQSYAIDLGAQRSAQDSGGDDS
ncbi:hypothetical protein [Nocardia sp. CNY236]|uniref:TPR repeat region-containing protein n=1 Tax=Nocardia sp. CNY236 TaxID=1169152 RepID=UPI000419B066|nr:hypothetical protein [Nocardia sp. CNY236]